MKDQITTGTEHEAAAESVAPERARKPREGWEVSLDEMAKNGDDKLLDWPEYLPTKFDLEEWEW